MADQPVVHIVDDDGDVRDSLGAALGAAGYDCRLYAGAGEFLDANLDEPSGCALLDVRMPGMDGLGLQREIRRRGIRLPVIFMTGFGDVPMAVKAMQAGAVDFVEKPCKIVDLRAALDRALAAVANAGEAGPDSGLALERLAQLTPRERDVFKAVVAGDANKVTAHRLGISPRTVEIHRARVMQKTKAKTLAELVRLALAAGVTARG